MSVRKRCFAQTRLSGTLLTLTLQNLAIVVQGLSYEYVSNTIICVTMERMEGKFKRSLIYIDKKKCGGGNRAALRNYSIIIEDRG